MKINGIAKRVSGLILTLGLLLAAPGLMGVKVLAHAQDRDRYYYDDDDYYRKGGSFTEADARRVGSINGYEAGYRRGTESGRYRHSYDFKDDRVYKDASLGYRSEYRHKDNYKKGFRLGFEQGYDDAYYGKGRDRSYRRGHGIEYNGPFGRIRF